MHRFLHSFLFLFATFFLFSCEKEEVPAKATIVIDKQILRVGEEVTIRAIGGYPVYYEWDFGTGFSGGTKEKTVSFSSPGRYTVRLRTTDANKKIAEEAVIVIVGDVYLTELIMTNFNFNDPDGNPWDSDGTGPDLVIGISGFTNGSTGTYRKNFTQRDLPLSISNTSVGLKIGNANLIISISEAEDPGTGHRLIFQKSVNPYQLLLNPAFNHWYPVGSNYPAFSLAFQFK